MRIAMLIALLLVSGCQVGAQRALRAPGASLVTAAAKPEIPDEVEDLLRRINRHRRSRGCPVLAWDSRLSRVARRHSEDMTRRRFFDHRNPDGVDPFERLERAGIHFRAAAENLAMSPASGQEVFEGWMGSRGHRRNLEECLYDRVGIARDGDYWTCVLARLTPASRL
jgi:uncharacterized protein YkwD